MKDVAQANLAALQGDVRPGIYNIGTTVETTVNALKEILFYLSGVTTAVYYDDVRDGDIIRSALDNGKAKAQLHWRPHTKLIPGLTSTYAYFAEEASRE